MKQNTIIAIDKSKSFRIYLTNSTDMADKAAFLHQTSITASAALGRVLTGAALMGLMLLKNESDKLTVQFKVDGPAGEILATANHTGQVKGYISNPNADLPLRNDGKLDVGGLLGEGTLTVIRDAKTGQPYVGRINLVSGEIAEDLTAYFFISEQQSTSVALGVKATAGFNVRSAGGMIIQMLPGAKENAADALEQILQEMDSISSLVERHPDIDDLLAVIFKNMPKEFEIVPLKHGLTQWVCDCSEQRMGEALTSIGEKDLKEIIREDGKAEIVCQFCQKAYNFNKKQLELLLAEAKAGG